MFAAKRRLGTSTRQTAQLHYAPDPEETWLAGALTRVALGTLHAALAGDAAQVEAVRTHHRYTEAFATLHRMDVPPEVRAWLRQALAPGGALHAAAESEVQLTLERLRGARPALWSERLEGYRAPGSDDRACAPFGTPPKAPRLSDEGV